MAELTPIEEYYRRIRPPTKKKQQTLGDLWDAPMATVRDPTTGKQTGKGPSLSAFFNFFVGETPTERAFNILPFGAALGIGKRIGKKTIREARALYTAITGTTRGKKRNLPLIHSSSQTGAELIKAARRRFEFHRSSDLEADPNIFQKGRADSGAEGHSESLDPGVSLFKFGGGDPGRTFITEVPDSIFVNMLNISPGRYADVHFMRKILEQNIATSKPLSFFHEVEIFFNREGRRMLLPRDMEGKLAQQGIRLAVKGNDARKAVMLMGSAAQSVKGAGRVNTNMLQPKNVEKVLQGIIGDVGKGTRANAWDELHTTLKAISNHIPDNRYGGGNKLGSFKNRLEKLELEAANTRASWDNMQEFVESTGKRDITPGDVTEINNFYREYVKVRNKLYNSIHKLDVTASEQFHYEKFMRNPPKAPRPVGTDINTLKGLAGGDAPVSLYYPNMSLKGVTKQVEVDDILSSALIPKQSKIESIYGPGATFEGLSVHGKKAFIKSEQSAAKKKFKLHGEILLETSKAKVTVISKQLFGKQFSKLNITELKAVKQSIDLPDIPKANLHAYKKYLAKFHGVSKFEDLQVDDLLDIQKSALKNLWQKAK
jgi:hypothetical protein